jgi:hypothetical protein
VSKFARSLVFLLPVVTLLAAGQAPSAPGLGVRERIARAADRVLKAGLQAKIPPHVSDLLRISAGLEECPVAQRFERNGKLVRGFNVSIADKNNIVLFVTDEASKEQTYYLTSGLGGLRKVVAVREGIGNVMPVAPGEKAAFERELKFWLDRIVPAATPK